MAITAELHTKLYDPHSVLGLHLLLDETNKVVRLWRPGASQVHLEVFGKVVEAKKVDEGLFEAIVPAVTTPFDYRVYHQNGLLANDPYAFTPIFGEMDAHLFARGVHYKLFEALGAHIIVHQNCAGTKFAVWAPNAKRVSLVGDFNYWDGRVNPMRSMGHSGVWELFVPGLGEGEKYKFEIVTQEGRTLLKADPFANSSELRPKTASVVTNVDRYQWQDRAWMEKRVREGSKAGPLNIYEVHLGSWKKKNGQFMSYRDIAHELAAYCQEMGFSHIELMPVAEHPFDESWGYQVTGFFAPTSRYGNPSDFQYFVDHMHSKGIGVIMDWVPAHFPTDDFSLAKFDGSALYEHVDPRKGFHPHWNTNIFNYGRFEVCNFLIANALFWFEKMHIDGLRVDAVASMLYLDYGRNEGEWIPNSFGGRENLEAIEFLKHLNSVVHHHFPHVLMIAEESTAFTGISHPLEQGGMGFDMKWNMGWMNDTLRYFSKDPIFRTYHQNDLTFGLIYAFSEKFALVLSHDEVVHGKGALLSKMPGDDWQKFANLRLLYSYMMCQPGKKLLFMGGEIGQWQEWKSQEELHWFLLKYDRHQQLQHFVKSLNHFYREHPQLWEYDFEGRGFEWIDFNDRKNCIISYLRKSSLRYLACIHNFTPATLDDYTIPLRNAKSVKEVFNSDHSDFGGSGKIHQTVIIVHDQQGKLVGFKTGIPSLATVIFEVEFESPY